MKSFLIVLPLFFCLMCKAQVPCELTVQEAPKFLDLGLGMSDREVQSILKGIVNFKPVKSGEFSFFQNYVDKRPPSKLSNVRALYLRFFDHRLYQLEIFYNEEPGGVRLTDFMKRLPVEPSMFVLPDASGGATMSCRQFILVVKDLINPGVELTDELGLAAFKEAEKRKKKLK